MTEQIVKTILKQSDERVALSVDNLHHKYNKGKSNEVYVLKGIDFEISAGEMVAIMGPSGCGKTTLLNIIGGLDYATRGSITIDNHIIGEMDDSELTKFRRDNIGYIFQLFNLFVRGLWRFYPHLSDALV